ncbi:PIG-L family deacetylase [Nesterenkonia pannonica]|uniref:PIG-L deacetylase family protein n=1 Tax=Nesterenkonia pannonica TaxID=1548602 RepID=UPI002164A7E5|nr:PIG-L deacetylase family protein [Nesterenkonia pannonica]
MTDALDLFDDSGIRRVLCIVAHPDDMEYGGSAAAARWSARGVEVSYLLLTAGEAGMRNVKPLEAAALRAEEQRAACAEVGVDELEILRFPDGMLQPDLALREAIARRIRQTRPHMVLTQTWSLEVSWGLNHADHRAAGLAAADAVRDADNPWVFRRLAEDEGLEAWGADWLLTFGDAPTHLIDVTGEPLERAVASLEAHKQYLAALGGDFDARGMLEGMTSAAAQRSSDPAVTQALGVAAHRM